MATLIGLALRIWRYAPLFGFLPLPLAWLALWGRSTTFSASCRLGLERTGAALAHGAVAVALFVAAIFAVSRWIGGPHPPSNMVLVFLLTSISVVVFTIAYAGQAVSLVVVGTLLRRAAGLDEKPYVSALVGFAVIYAVGLMPFVGRTITLVMSSLGVGSLLVHMRSWRKPAAAAGLFLLLAVPSKAGTTPFYELREKQISKELAKIHKKHPNLPDRVAAVSERFLGTPYRLGPLGEGPTGEYDRLPLYDFRRVDCTTFVEQVMALSLEPDLDKALETLRKIRYKDGQVSYETRNHFTELDWVPHNRWAGYLKDITLDVAPDKTRTATKKVSKRDWYVHKSTADVLGFGGDAEAEKERRLGHLRELGAKYQDEMAALPYVPMQNLPQLLERIPSGTLANLVRADQPDKETMVSHQILLIRKGKTLYVRHAAFDKQVEDVPALDYFYRYFNSSWPLLGLNLQEITKPK